MPGPGGSRKGIPNKRTQEFRERLDALCEEHDFDLVGALVLQAKGECPVINAGLREDEGNATYVNSARKLLIDYAYPKLKAMEVTNTEPTRIVIVDEAEEAAAAAAAATDPLLD